MKKQRLSYTLQSGQVVTAKAYNITQLSAMYQIWAREEHGVTDEISLACFIANMPFKHGVYFSNTEEVQRLAEIGFAQTAGPIPDLSDIGKNTEMCYTYGEN